MNIYLTAINAALQAGKEILDVYNSNDFQVEKKQDDSPLTRADRKGHNKIMECLESTHIPVLSEEGVEIPYEERSTWGKLWIVDPLDGTKEFIKRNGEFTVNIALIENGVAVFGVIYVPVTRELYVGLKQVGSYKFNDSTFVNVSMELSDFLKQGTQLPLKVDKPFTVVASRSHLSEETQEFIEDLKKEHADLIFISKGSSLKLCAVAEGLADIYPRFAPTMEWDTAAGQAIVEAMGGKVSQPDGAPLMYNRKNLRNPWFIVSAI